MKRLLAASTGSRFFSSYSASSSSSSSSSSVSFCSNFRVGFSAVPVRRFCVGVCRSTGFKMAASFDEATPCSALRSRFFFWCPVYFLFHSFFFLVFRTDERGDGIAVHQTDGIRFRWPRAKSRVKAWKKPLTLDLEGISRGGGGGGGEQHLVARFERANCGVDGAGVDRSASRRRRRLRINTARHRFLGRALLFCLVLSLFFRSGSDDYRILSSFDVFFLPFDRHQLAPFLGH